jgi:hypothetical protein
MPPGLPRLGASVKTTQQRALTEPRGNITVNFKKPCESVGKPLDTPGEEQYMGWALYGVGFSGKIFIN